MACEQPIKPERVTDTDNVARGVVIESERNVEVDLLGSVQTNHRAGIQEQARTRTFRIVADIFGKQAKLLGQLLFEHDGGSPAVSTPTTCIAQNSA